MPPRIPDLLLALLVLGGADCVAGEAKPEPQRTQLSGQVYRRPFTSPTAAFAPVEGPPRALLIRVADRDETCLAALDPSDFLDPSLLISVTPEEVGSYPVIDPATHLGAPPLRYATATLLTYTDLPDGGPPDGGDAGLRPVILKAHGGEVTVEALDTMEDGRLDAEVVLLFGDGGYAGSIGAVPCERVR